MTRTSRFLPLFLLTLTPALHAQATRPYDPDPLLRQLADPASAKAAAASIEKLPAQALGPLYDALLSDDTPEAVRRLLDDQLSKLHERLRIQHREQQDLLVKQWFDKTGPDFFRSLPHDNPADALTQKALDDIRLHPDDIFALVKPAYDAGSRDPLILYYYSSRCPEDWPAEKRVQLALDCAQAFEHARYPAGRKVYALLRCAAILSFPANAPALKAANVPLVRANQFFSQALDLLPKVAAENLDDSNIRQLLDLARMVAMRLNNDNPSLTFNRLYTPFHNAFPHNAAIPAYAADFYTTWAWQARGSGFASTVSDDGWNRFRQRLDQAEKFALEATRADPVAPDGPTEMLTVGLGKSFEKPAVTAWFHRAMNANPDNYSACMAMLTYLLPQWNGSSEEALAFGRQCARNGTALNRIPLVLIAAHQQIQKLADDHAAYMLQPDVWPDFQGVYEKILDEETGKVPDSTLRADRARYLKAAAECQEWNDFSTLSEKFGDALDLDAFGGKPLLDFYKKKAAAASKDPA